VQEGLNQRVPRSIYEKRGSEWPTGRMFPGK